MNRKESISPAKPSPDLVDYQHRLGEGSFSMNNSKNTNDHEQSEEGEIHSRLFMSQHIGSPSSNTSYQLLTSSSFRGSILSTPQKPASASEARNNKSSSAVTRSSPKRNKSLPVAPPSTRTSPSSSFVSPKKFQSPLLSSSASPRKLQPSPGKRHRLPLPTGTPSSVAAEGGGGTERSAAAALKEVDFYRNPTILSRLVLNQKYAAAIQRVHRIPEEAATWVCVIRAKKATALPSPPGDGRPSPSSLSKRKNMSNTDVQRTTSTTSSGSSSREYSLRQLPIHMACHNLKRTFDSKIRDHLNRLIMVLTVMYPMGSYQPDHHGKIPLHVAISYGAYADTIKIFLMTHPPLLDSCDEYGRTLSEMNTYPSEQRQEQIQQALNKGKRFYEIAHQEGLKHQQRQQHERKNHHGSNNKTMTATASSKTGGIVAPERTTLSLSTRALIDRTTNREDDDETVETGCTSQVTSISWDQLEKRTIAMEQILTEVNEENYVLKIRMEQMNKNRNELVQQLEQHHPDTKLVQEISILNEQNMKLREQLEHVKLMLETSLQDDESWMNSPSSGGGGFDSMPVRLLSDIHMIMEKYHTLRERNYEYYQTLGMLKKFVLEPLSARSLGVGSHSVKVTDANKKYYYKEQDADDTEMSVVPFQSQGDYSSDEGHSTLSSSIRSPHRSERLRRQESQHQYERRQQQYQQHYHQQTPRDAKLVDWTPPQSSKQLVTSHDRLSDFVRRFSPMIGSGRVLAGMQHEQLSSRSRISHAATAHAPNNAIVLSGKSDSNRHYQINEEWGADAITPIAKSRSSVARLMPPIPMLESPNKVSSGNQRSQRPSSGPSTTRGMVTSSASPSPLAEIPWKPVDDRMGTAYDELDTLTAVLRETSGEQDFDHLSAIFRAAAHNNINRNVMHASTNTPLSGMAYDYDRLNRMEAWVAADAATAPIVEYRMGFEPSDQGSTPTSTSTTVTGPKLPSTSGSTPTTTTSGGNCHSFGHYDITLTDIDLPAFRE